MPQALVRLDENTNRILNVVKAKYDLRDKSDAIAFLADKYIEDSEDPELRPEFIRKIQRIEKEGKWIRYRNVAELKREIEGAAVRAPPKKAAR